MLAIIGGRQTGKTACLIEMSKETGYPILTATCGMADSIEHQAMKMNAHIPPVIPVSRMMLDSSIRAERVIVDELGLVIESLIGVKVVSASINGLAMLRGKPPSTDLSKLGIWNVIKLWRSERKRARSGGEGM